MESSGSRLSPGSTSSSLLLGAKGGDQSAWSQLVALYGPLIYHWCRKDSLNPADAADVVQEVFRTVSRNLRKFAADRENSSFRGWLRTITRSRIIDFLRRQDVVQARGGTTAHAQLQNEPSEQGSCVRLEDEHRFDSLYAALETLRQDIKEHTWEAFWRTTVEGQAASDVAHDLGLSRGAVLEAKSRTLRRLRQMLGKNFEI